MVEELIGTYLELLRTPEHLLGLKAEDALATYVAFARIYCQARPGGRYPYEWRERARSQMTACAIAYDAARFHAQKGVANND